MKTVSVFYSIFLSEEFVNPQIRDYEILMPSWADCAGNADAVVREIARNNVLGYAFDDWFDDNSSGKIFVELSCPASIAGRYAVDIKRSFEFSSQKLEACP